MARTAKQETHSIKERSLREVIIRLIGTAPVLVAHPLPWDIMSYWDSQPKEISKTKVKRPGRGQRELLVHIQKNGYDLDFQPYDTTEERGLDVYQETILRGHWLPDYTPGRT